ncbi:MAG: hypothetical protein JWQ11_4831 [Rhizobacter sp.]|nr:hypothetical protein [Rhizobacter sp.]
MTFPKLYRPRVVHRGRSSLRDSLAWSATAIGLSLLAACGDKTAGTPESIPTPVIVESTPAADAPAQTADKLNRYTEAYNKLADTLGLEETFKAYREQNVPEARTSDTLIVSDGWIGTANESLRLARAAPGQGLKDLDARADTLIDALGKLTTQLQDLEIYYKTKAYVQDDLARGKSEHASLMASFEASEAAAKGFDEVLGNYQHARAQARLERLKASGDALRYQTALAMEQAAPLFKLFKDPADFRNPDLLKQADAQVVELEKTLVEQRRVMTQKGMPVAAASASADTREEVNTGKATVSTAAVPAKPGAPYAELGSHLSSMIANYREMKHSGDPSDFASMVDDYNAAIGNANGLND